MIGLVLPHVGAVLLAAGASRRFGRGSKLMAEIDGAPLLRRVADVLVLTGLKHVVVVTGDDPDTCREALSGLPVRFAENIAWRRGIGSSIATGIAALGGGVDGAFIVPGDMPFLTPALLGAMVAEFAPSGQHPIVFPVTAQGEQRNPVLWPRRFFPKLMSLSGAEGAKRLLRETRSEAVAVTVDDAAVLADIDTSADLAAARARIICSRRTS